MTTLISQNHSKIYSNDQEIFKSMKYLLTIGLTVFLLSQSMSQSPQFQFRRKLKGIDSAGWYSLIIPPSVIKNSNSSFSDFRVYQIANNDTTDAPYIIKVRERHVTEVNEVLPAFNQTMKGGKQYLTFELKKGQLINTIDLSFAESNYDGLAVLEGSMDQKDWFKITRQRIIAIQNENTQFVSSKLIFPLVNYGYLRLQLDTDRPLTFNSAYSKNQVIDPGMSSESKLVWNATNYKAIQQTIINIELTEYQPVSQFSITLTERTDYYRPFRLERLIDSTKTQKGWEYFYEPIEHGYITSLSRNEFYFNYALSKKLRLIISNTDNAPLTIENISITSPQVELIARMNNNRDSYLYYGNQQIAAPTYDLVLFKDKVPSRGRLISLEEEESITTKLTISAAIFENQIWLWIIMVLMMGILGFFTFRMIKSK